MAAPLRTLSARILLGFASVIVTFGITTVLIVTYMNDVGEEIGIIRTGYLRLALTTKDLARKQDDLRSYVADDLVGEASARRVELRLRALRNARDRLLAEARTTLAEVADVPARHAKRLERTRDDVARLSETVAAQDARYARLLASPPLEVTAGPRHADATAALTELKVEERAISQIASNLAEYQERAVTSTAKNLEHNEARLRVYTIILGLIAMVVGLLVTVWVTLTLRPLRRLREGARRIGAGDPDARIDERGPAEVADLAREFNAMARAVDQRQRELVRSERLDDREILAVLAHEVGHIVFDVPCAVDHPARCYRSVTKGPGCLDRATQRSERRANEFMGAVLVPPASLHLRLVAHARAEKLRMVHAPNFGRPGCRVLAHNTPIEAVAGIVAALAGDFGVSDRFIAVRLQRYRLIEGGRL